MNRKAIPFIRFNTEDFPLKAKINQQLDDNFDSLDLEIPAAPKSKAENITSVWYRRPEDPNLPDSFTQAEAIFAQKEIKATLRGVWKTMDSLWVNDPEKNRLANIKLSQLKLAKNLGLAIPKTLMTNDPQRALDFFNDCNQKMILKPFESGVVGTGLEAEAIYTSVVSTANLETVHSINYTPVLLQEYVPKEKELRITIVGSEVFTAAISSQDNLKTMIDWRRDPYGVQYNQHPLPKTIKDKCLKMTNKLGLNFGAIDMIVTPDGDYVFLEINPNGQWAWIEDLTAMPIADTLSDFLAGKKH